MLRGEVERVDCRGEEAKEWWRRYKPNLEGSPAGT